MHSWVVKASSPAKVSSPGKWRQQHWRQLPRQALQPHQGHLQSEAEDEVADEVREEAGVAEEAPQEEHQPPQAGLCCLKEPPHLEVLSYQRPMVKQKSRNKMDQSLQQTGRQPPLLMLQPLPLSPRLPLSQNLLLLRPLWKYQNLLLQNPLQHLSLPLLLHL